MRLSTAYRHLTLQCLGWLGCVLHLPDDIVNGSVMKLSRRAVILGSLGLLAEMFIGWVARADSASQDSVLSDAVDAYVYGYPLVVTEITRRVITNVRVPGPQSAPMGQFGQKAKRLSRFVSLYSKERLGRRRHLFVVQWR